MKPAAAGVSIKEWKKLKMKISLKLTFLLLFFGGFGFCQNIPLGSWRSHLNYSNTRLVAEDQNRIYAASEFGFYYFDLEDNSLNKLTKNDGFGDVGITALAAIPDVRGLIIGYESGMIDLLDADNNLTSIAVIKGASIHPEKRINDIDFYNELAYLATDFGLVALDYKNKIIKESYSRIGSEGKAIQVNAGAVYDDSIFLSTEEGIIATALAASNNLLDFNNWKRFAEGEGIPGGNSQGIASFNDGLCTAVDEDGIYYYKNNRWEVLAPSTANFYNFKVAPPYLYIFSSKGVLKIDEKNEIVPIVNDNLSRPSDIVIDQKGNTWWADENLGLVTNTAGTFENMHPDGPFTDHLNRLQAMGTNIAAIKGVLPQDASTTNAGAFAIFEEGEWLEYSEEEVPALSGIYDFTDITFSPGTEMLYLSSFGRGVLGWKPQEGESLILDADSPESTLGEGGISALSADALGRIWLIEYGFPDQLHVYYENESSWQNMILEVSKHALEILPIPFGNLWIRLEENLLVASPEDGSARLLTTSNGLINKKINALAEDKNGYLWYGTDDGVAYIANPGEAIENEISTIVPFYEDTPLFRNKAVTAIAVDGGNRKWIATNEGLWLFEEDADVLVAHYTEDNSPLLSNTILDLAIIGNTGEIFVATDKGLVSFRSNASEGLTSHGQVKIFPNPVKEGYNGQIGITGLVQDAVVKITDISGNLVREVNAEGGTASWDGNTLSGARVKTGIYLIFSASSDGKETFIGKLAVVN